MALINHLPSCNHHTSSFPLSTTSLLPLHTLSHIIIGTWHIYSSLRLKTGSSRYLQITSSS